jgi:hypothetical protein
LREPSFDLIEVYWQYLGKPVSIFTGWVSDAIPFSISEILLQLSILSFILFIFNIISKKRRRLVKYSIPGICVLIIMALSQGITVIDCVPTVFRSHPFDRLLHVDLSNESLLQFVENSTQSFSKKIVKLNYENYSHDYQIKEANKIADRALDFMNYPKGREVRSVKNMFGLSKLLGLSYGGSAYHDVVSGEVVIANQADYPATKSWRRMCLVHEIIHAKGFTREMDTEILTWLALRLSDSKLDQAFADMMVIYKSKIKYKWPNLILEEWHQVLEARKKLAKKTKVLNFLKSISKKINIQNSSHKYGSIKIGEQYAKSEFLKSIAKLEKLINQKE